MARTKEFDPDAALARALELFWERGYEATSMADLVEHLEIGRASLYATFDSKHELYLKALRRYLETRDPDPIALLSQPGPALPAVRTLVESYVAESINDERHRGCMIVNAAAELMPHDHQVAQHVETSWSALEAALTGALTRARAQDEIGPDADPIATARFLVVFLQGVRLVGKGPMGAARLRDAADQALSMLT
ncbi:TetR/AcrR family transcriptional regulator [Phytoactinopolyspora halotolerans]|uniref:TetR/AcrR family transcriptional regulator n=1 Tax=Phytoactinopolyspora halotolerans TaxID=1981512 RepID=A0A6L9S5I5_9ACTN|nr:TetR/AcrR family transcriptional regulator [Phytoactinopolyspora halotolerans]NED99757.1 TetR/AcrR family transcriptional regulator [Phytoactinopolyspora halotolerans]